MFTPRFVTRMARLTSKVRSRPFSSSSSSSSGPVSSPPTLRKPTRLEVSAFFFFVAAAGTAVLSIEASRHAWKDYSENGFSFDHKRSSSLKASDAPHPPHYPWYHNGKFSAFDTAGIRRGFEVYRQVCSSCHSLEYKSYRELIGVSHTEEQAKALARSIEVTDGTDKH